MNHVVIVGKVDTEPVRKEVNGSVVCTFRLASGRSGHKGGRLWIDVETWGALAGTCYQHLVRGRQVIVAGRLVQKQWPDPTTGEKRSRLIVAASEVAFTEKRPSDRSD
jgi:single-strand DNA-binding protein